MNLLAKVRSFLEKYEQSPPTIKFCSYYNSALFLGGKEHVFCSLTISPNLRSACHFAVAQ